MQTRMFAAALAVGLMFTSAAQAQWGPGWGGGWGGWGGGYRHASTAEQGALDGMASVISSAGYANLMNSQAAQGYQQAYTQYLQNRSLATQTYFEMRQMNRAYREQERGPPPTQEQLTRWAAERAPDRLSTNDVDPLTGVIAWPLILQQDKYAALREPLDQAFARRAQNSGRLGPDDFLSVQQGVRDLQAELRKNIREYPSPQYLESRNFLESLSFEAGFVSS